LLSNTTEYPLYHGRYNKGNEGLATGQEDADSAAVFHELCVDKPMSFMFRRKVKPKDGHCLGHRAAEAPSVKGMDMKWLRSLFKWLHAVFSGRGFTAGIDPHAWETKTEVWRSFSSHG
jgi:hypothetical protein